MGRDQMKKRRKSASGAAADMTTMAAAAAEEDAIDRPRVSRQWEEAHDEDIALPVKRLDGTIVFPAAAKRSSSKKRRRGRGEIDEHDDDENDDNDGGDGPAGSTADRGRPALIDAKSQGFQT